MAAELPWKWSVCLNDVVPGNCETPATACEAQVQGQAPEFFEQGAEYSGQTWMYAAENYWDGGSSTQSSSTPFRWNQNAQAYVPGLGADAAAAADAGVELPQAGVNQPVPTKPLTPPGTTQQEWQEKFPAIFASAAEALNAMRNGDLHRALMFAHEMSSSVAKALVVVRDEVVSNAIRTDGPELALERLEAVYGHFPNVSNADLWSQVKNSWVKRTGIQTTQGVRRRRGQGRGDAEGADQSEGNAPHEQDDMEDGQAAPDAQPDVATQPVQELREPDDEGMPLDKSRVDQPLQGYGPVGKNVRLNIEVATGSEDGLQGVSTSSGSGTSESSEDGSSASPGLLNNFFIEKEMGPFKSRSAPTGRGSAAK